MCYLTLGRCSWGEMVSFGGGMLWDGDHIVIVERAANGTGKTRMSETAEVGRDLCWAWLFGGYPGYIAVKVRR